MLDLKNRHKQLCKILESCELCPRKCKANRLKGEKGYCGTGKELEISSIGPHFGEEPELVGRGGSGTVFLTHCNLKCVFCQNEHISHFGEGQEVSAKNLAKGLVNLQKIGCHNINFVTPTHYAPQIIEAVILAKEQGLNLPLVFNCGGYESLEVIKLLDGIVDIYMPDIKFASHELVKKYCNAEDYFERAKEAVKEMYRQVGDLVVEDGIAKKGLLIRHLVMPGLVEDSKKILDFIANDISKNTYVNIMDQYRPSHEAGEFSEINRRITSDEYKSVLEYARKIGLRRGF